MTKYWAERERSSQGQCLVPHHVRVGTGEACTQGPGLQGAGLVLDVPSHGGSGSRCRWGRSTGRDVRLVALSSSQEEEEKVGWLAWYTGRVRRSLRESGKMGSSCNHDYR